MQTNYENFLTTFYKFIYDVNRYSPTEGAARVLEIFNDLDYAKIIFKTYHLLKDNSTKITNKDETLFLSPFVVLPDIDLSQMWEKLMKGQKMKIWTYLSILHLESDLIMSQTNKDIQTMDNNNNTSTDLKEFNPYEGIGTNNQEYSVEEMYSSLANMETDDEISTPGIETIARMIGLNKIINMDELQEQLRNMTKEDIENATDNIKNLLGKNVDEKTSNLINDMLTGISDEMKTREMGKGDGLKNIVSVAKKVAGQMQPQIQRDNIDVEKLIDSTKIFADQCKNKDGTPMFNGKVNPFEMLGKLAKSANTGNMTEAQCQNDCNEMLRSMGMQGVDIGSMSNPMQMQQMMQQMMQRTNSNSSNSGNNRRGRRQNK